jgi:hypothetical protein
VISNFNLGRISFSVQLIFNFGRETDLLVAQQFLLKRAVPISRKQPFIEKMA